MSVALVLYGAGLAASAVLGGRIVGVILAAVGGVDLAGGAAVVVVALGHQRRRGASLGVRRAVVVGWLLIGSGVVALAASVVHLRR